MNNHLADIAQTVAPGDHGAIVLGGVGWHHSKVLVIPDNVSGHEKPCSRDRRRQRPTLAALTPNRAVANPLTSDICKVVLIPVLKSVI